ncbi:hypothetical protein [Kitasatospora paracochleata]|uniref:Uncharacterized protein n=1 Tax=Kitasatospora paracochleata TaxID=58354 RepID=A0ABT1IUE7_9ACTN|nr:hypothetical protein [Kitasatospora paracochleata]MCP2308763.1 hypothetical protein [Kitasatospora paracochleata]
MRDAHWCACRKIIIERWKQELADGSIPADWDQIDEHVDFDELVTAANSLADRLATRLWWLFIPPLQLIPDEDIPRLREAVQVLRAGLALDAVLGRMSAAAFQRRVAAINSGALLASALQSVGERPAMAPEPEPVACAPPVDVLGCACGVTRLTVALVPRAPGSPSGACDHAIGRTAVDRTTSRQDIALAA